MKLLYVGDVHATGKSPSSRIDIYPNAIKDKLIEVGKISKEEKIDAIILGGDLFHHDTVANKFAGEIITILRNWKKPIYIVPGNHDCTGYNTETLGHSTLGVLESAGVLTCLTRKNPIVGRIGKLKIAIEGQEYCVGIDSNPDNYSKKVKADINILIAHGMLQPKPILEQIRHTLIKDIPNPASITIAAHDHVGWKLQELNGNFFLNPGSIGRVDCGAGMKEHKPCVTIINIEESKTGEPNLWIKSILLKNVKPFNEVFDVAKAQMTSNQLQDDFVNTINSVNNSSNGNKIDPETFIHEMLKDNAISEEVADNCISYLAESKKDIGSNNLTVYSKSKQHIFIKSIELKNFLTHKNSKIDFVDGFNAIYGANGAGKTSVLTAIHWVLYDTPKGISFIRTGQSSCEVKITFNNRTYIRKTRTKSTGTYYVFNGEKEEIYKGYGNNLPIEIVNTHQMPLVNLYKDKLVSLNYGDQLNGLFLVGESPSEKAEALGKLTGADVIDDSISKVTLELKRKKIDIKPLANNIEELEVRIKERTSKLCDLDNKIVKIKNILEEIENKQQILDKICNLLLLNNKEKSFNNKKIDLTNDVDSMEYLISSTSKLIKLLQTLFDYKNISLQYDSCLKKSKLLKREINSYSDIHSTKNPILLSSLIDYLKVIDNIKQLDKKKNEIKSKALFNSSLDPSVCDLSIMLVQVLAINSCINEENDYIKTYEDKIEKDLCKLDTITKNISKVEKTLHENGVCPLCNSKLEENNIKYILSKRR